MRLRVLLLLLMVLLLVTAAVLLAPVKERMARAATREDTCGQVRRQQCFNTLTQMNHICGQAEQARPCEHRMSIIPDHMIHVYSNPRPVSSSFGARRYAGKEPLVFGWIEQYL
jgi:hypothetical protein